MLTIEPIQDTDQAVSYFSKGDSYYLSDPKAKEHSVWWGKGAKELGLEGNIDEAKFREICDGKLPNGDILGIVKEGVRQFRPGFDITFSAPKSVSILALVCGDQKLLEAHRDAVKKTLSIIESECAQARHFKDGRMNYEDTGNLTVACFEHGVSRELDPQLHTHSVIQNVTKRSDGQWRALSSCMKQPKNELNGFRERMYDRQICYGAIYRSELASSVINMGLAIEVVGPHGMWEIKGMPKSLIDDFSKRRAQILDVMARYNLESPKGGDYANKFTRKVKPEEIDFSYYKKTWSETCASHHFDGDEFLKSLPEGSSPGTNVNKQKEISGAELDKAREAVLDAIDTLSQIRLKFDFNQIMEKALSLCIGESNYTTIRNAIEYYVENGMLLPINESNSLYTTQKLIDYEIYAKETIKQSLNNEGDVKSDDIIKVGSESKIESTMAYKVLSSGNRYSLVDCQDMSHSGLLEELSGIATKSNLSVTFLAPNKSIASSIKSNLSHLNKSSPIWTRIFQRKTNDVYSVNQYLYQINNTLESNLKCPSILIIDETEQLNHEQLNDLLIHAESTKNRLVFLNHVVNRDSYRQSNAVSILKSTDITKYIPDKIQHIKRTHPIDVHANDDPQVRVSEIASHYANLPEDIRKSTAIVSLSNSDKAHINNEVRSHLKSNGSISQYDQYISTEHSVFLGNAEKKLAKCYPIGGAIRFFEKGKKADTWEIVKRHINSNTITIKNANGDEKRWNPRNENGGFGVYTISQIPVATGDKVKLTQKAYKSNLPVNKTISVIQIKNGIIKLNDGNLTHKMRLSDLSGLSIEHDYVKSLPSISTVDQFSNVLIYAKSSSLHKDTINLFSKNTFKVSLYTDDKTEASKKLGRAKVMTTATSIADNQHTYHANVVNNEYLTQVRKDIYALTGGIITNNKIESAEKAINFAMSLLTDRDAGFSHKDLIATAISHSITAGITIDELQKLIDYKISIGQIHPGIQYRDDQLLTTEKCLSLENSILSNLTDGKQRLSRIIDPSHSTEILEKTKLTAGQRSACHMIFTVEDRFCLIQGFAGTGKTTLFKNVEHVIKNHGMALHAIAPTHRAVMEFKNRGVSAQTLTSFLIDMKHDPNYLSNKLLVLDEASMVSNTDFYAYTKIVNDTNTRSVICGDRLQHLPIGSGKPYEIAQRKNIIQTAYMTDIVRQDNSTLKGAVQDTIADEINQSFSKLISMPIDKNITRLDKHSFFDMQEKSVFESKDLIDHYIGKNEKYVPHPKMDPKGDNTTPVNNTDLMQRASVDDYISRTPGVRANTLFIVHAHEDRESINSMIRSGLKDNGEISKHEITVNRLVQQPITNTEKQFGKYYKQGNVIKIGRKYFTILSVNESNNTIKISDGLTNQYVALDKTHMNIELFTIGKAPISNGDKLHFTKTDKSRNRLSNIEYTVTDIKNDAIRLQDKKGIDLSLDISQFNDMHWDYAYTVTSYSAQGATKKYVIDYECSWRKNLTNKRSFYIAESRAISHVMLYTDDKKKLLDQLDNNHAEKLAALEVSGDLKIDDASPKKLEDNNPTTSSKRVSKNSKPYSQAPGKIWDVGLINEKLMSKPVDTYLQIFGKPKSKTSSQLSYPGGLKVTLTGSKSGLWYDFSSHEGGGPINAIQQAYNIGFKDALKVGARIAGIDEDQATRSNTMNRDVIEKQTKQNRMADKVRLEQRIRTATSIWENTTALRNTTGQRYLNGHRKISELSGTAIKFFPIGAKWISYDKKGNEVIKVNKFPAIAIKVVDKNGDITGVQTVFLDEKTSRKNRFMKSPKISRGKVSGSVGIIRHTKDSDRIYIAEGPETAASIAMADKKSTVLVSLGVHNLLNINDSLRQFTCKNIIIAADNDGINSKTYETTIKAANNLKSAGFDVSIIQPKPIRGLEKTDWNDILQKHGINELKKQLIESSENLQIDMAISKKAGELVKDEINHSRAVADVSDKVRLENEISKSSESTKTNASDFVHQGKNTPESQQYTPKAMDLIDREI